MEIRVGDAIHFTEDFPNLIVVEEAAAMGSGKIARKTAQYWVDRREDVYVIERR
ncbi:hypothetical protein [Sporosarcina koreensis]|uniref:hypothetical protein n=1 Tax=Sporosarcina koreensis TaxID=334735 RepID=UPI000A8B52DB|nr:hypothetical protein [Sporosarcina koreensis]